MPFLHGSIHHCDQFCVHLEIGKSLAKVDGFVLNGQSTHDSENGSAYVREFALYGWFQLFCFWFFVKNNQSFFKLAIAGLWLL